MSKLESLDLSQLKAAYKSAERRRQRAEREEIFNFASKVLEKVKKNAKEGYRDELTLKIPDRNERFASKVIERLSKCNCPATQTFRHHLHCGCRDSKACTLYIIVKPFWAEK